jgi:hypothetical protein
MTIFKHVFKDIGKVFAGKNKKEEVPVGQQTPAQPVNTDSPGEVYAAIAMALYLYSNELHDQENPVITMIRTSKTYSPWSSKIYSLRRLPR